MSDKNKLDRRIAASELPPLKAWAFPRVGGAHVVRSPFKERTTAADTRAVDEMAVSSGPLTVAEIQKLRTEAKQQGFAQGEAEGKRAGHQQGLESGRKEGYQAAYQQAETEINDLKARLVAMQSALEKPLELQAEGLEAAVMRLVVDTAEAVVKQELATRPELLRHAVQEAIDALPQQAQQLCFFVHPNDQELLQQLSEQQRANWEIVSDPALTPGSLRARGECSYLDYTVENRFQQVVEQVLTAEPSDSDSGAGDEPTG